MEMCGDARLRRNSKWVNQQQKNTVYIKTHLKCYDLCQFTANISIFAQAIFIEKRVYIDIPFLLQVNNLFTYLVQYELTSYINMKNAQ